VLKRGEFLKEKVPVNTACIGAVSLDGSVIPVVKNMGAVLVYVK